ncbi:MAG: tRNA (adenosine(37)-N6)-threonylcarbamoyltransferase complex transferase subunit TsaD [Microgenomates group bacterium]|jgi:N6-L-threonylcarbamoyladenine synthase
MKKDDYGNPKIIMGIESSCDETAVAICLKDDNGVHILSNIVASSASLQAKYGGVIPEQAAREQLSNIIPATKEALEKAGLKPVDIDAIAITEGPGLIGSLLIGVETAKALATIWQKPLIPINHLLGHFYANWINQQSPTFPCLGLLVSGGHTDLILFSDHGKYKYLGGTRDDAAGECFDKCARLLGLAYPGGPNLSKLAEKGNPKAYQLPRPMLNSKDLDFSFSGLKTAVSNIIKAGDSERGAPLTARNEVRTLNGAASWQDPHKNADLAASIEDAITDVLVEKTITAIQTHNVDQVIVAGGVAANKTLAKKLTQRLAELIPHAKLFIPSAELATDNAASIAAAAFFNYYPTPPLDIQANPNLSLDNDMSQP